MSAEINIEYHGKNLADFQLKRSWRAMAQMYSAAKN